MSVCTLMSTNVVVGYPTIAAGQPDNGGVCCRGQVAGKWGYHHVSTGLNGYNFAAPSSNTSSFLDTYNRGIWAFVSDEIVATIENTLSSKVRLTLLTIVSAC